MCKRCEVEVHSPQAVCLLVIGQVSTVAIMEMILTSLHRDEIIRWKSMFTKGNRLKVIYHVLHDSAVAFIVVVVVRLADASAVSRCLYGSVA